MVLSRFNNLAASSSFRLTPQDSGLSSQNPVANDLLSYGRFQRQRGNLQEAARIFSQLAQTGEDHPANNVPLAIRQRAQEQLNAIQGVEGFTAARAEFLADTFMDQVFDPASLGAMVGAGLTYSVARFGLLNSAARLGMQSRWVSPAASLLAFGAEASMFPIYGRLGNMALGREVDWSRAQLQQDILGSFLVLGGLKLFGAVGHQSLGWWQQGGRVGGGLAQRILPTLVPQTAMYLGILSGHQAEEWTGLREATSTGQLLSESLVTLLHFNGMGRLIPIIAGSRMRTLEHRLEQESYRMGQGENGRGGEGRMDQVWTGLRQLTSGPEFAFAGFSEKYSPLLPEMGTGISGEFIRLQMEDELQGEVGGESTSLVTTGLSRRRALQARRSQALQDAQGFYEYLQGEFQRLRDHWEERSARSEDIQDLTVDREIEEIADRLIFWREQLDACIQKRGKAGFRFAQDIRIGQGLLLNRITQLGVSLFPQALPGTPEELGLRSLLDLPENAPNPSEDGGRLGTPLPGLKNHDIGFGRELRLRAHQIQALQHIRAWMASQRSGLVEGRIPEQIFLEGTVVMPVGSGKTRTMVASFASALADGAFQPNRGDKIILLNHTTQIHTQNYVALGRMARFFRGKVGRRLSITQFKADQRDVSGDVVVVSIPSLTQESNRLQFQESLKESLGPNGQVVMVALDEVHHLEMGKASGRRSWQAAVETLREISPQFFQLGFTATPTGREPNVLFRLREPKLMQWGILPRSYLVKVEGEDLTQLRISRNNGDFSQRDLISTLMEFPKRNLRLLEALEAHGIRSENPSPSGRERLCGVLGFAADLAHARMMVEAYQDFFSNEGEGLRGRRLFILGKDKGKIRRRDWESALTAFRNAEVDGIVAVLGGETSVNLRPEILTAVERGEVEAVFTVDALVEGADLHMFRNQLGARPTLSRIKKGQERGRMSRRGPGEIGRRGELISDPPRILFEVWDQLHNFNFSLARYRDTMGIRGQHGLMPGQLLDVLRQEAVDRVDLTGRAIPIADLPTQSDMGWRGRFGGAYKGMYAPLVKSLRELLNQRYDHNLERMAHDLGESVNFLENLLLGRGWQANPWYLRRMATLLYQDRDQLLKVYREMRGERDARITSADVALLRGALNLYQEVEGGIISGQNVNFRAQMPWGEETVVISSNTLLRIQQERMTEVTWQHLWRSLTNYFYSRRRSNPDFEKTYQNLSDHYFARQGWSREAEGGWDRLLLEGRRRVALRWGWRLPTQINHETGFEDLSSVYSNSPLLRWLNGEDVGFSSNRNSGEFFRSVRVLLRGLGLEESKTEDLIRGAVFERRGWSTEPSNGWESLLLEARQGLAQKWGGTLPVMPGEEVEFEGLPMMGSRSPLRKWLYGENFRYSSKITPEQFYNQIRILLRGFGTNESRIDHLIMEAIFTRRNWPSEARNALEQLLLETRRGVAIRWGGYLPRHPNRVSGFEDLQGFNSNSPIRNWIDRGDLALSPQNTPRRFFSQVKKLLNGLGVEPGRIDDLIRDAVFEHRDWPREARDGWERLLLETRRAVALRFGGRLPVTISNIFGFEDLPGNMNSGNLLRKWFNGEELKFTRRQNPTYLFRQVRILLNGLGVDEGRVQDLITDAAFAQGGWSFEARDGWERLLLEVRRRVASRWGWRLPYEITREPGFERLPRTFPRNPNFTAWLKGEVDGFSSFDQAELFFSRIRIILTGLGMAGAEADQLITEARESREI